MFPQIIQELQDSFEYSVFYSVSTRNPATPSNSAYRINFFSKKYYNYKAHPVQAPSSNCFPCLQAFYTAEQGSHSTPSAPYTSRLPVILPGRNSILHGSQHPRSPYSSSQASSTVLHYRILPGFIPKGLSIVYPCNTKVSVFQFTYSCFRIILQEN